MLVKFIYKNYINLISFIRRLVSRIFPQSKYYKKIKSKKRRLELILNPNFKTENELSQYEGSVQDLQVQEITSSTYHEFISRILDIRKTY